MAKEISPPTRRRQTASTSQNTYCYTEDAAIAAAIGTLGYPIAGAVELTEIKKGDVSGTACGYHLDTQSINSKYRGSPRRAMDGLRNETLWTSDPEHHALYAHSAIVNMGKLISHAMTGERLEQIRYVGSKVNLLRQGGLESVEATSDYLQTPNLVITSAAVTCGCELITSLTTGGEHAQFAFAPLPGEDVESTRRLVENLSDREYRKSSEHGEVLAVAVGAIRSYHRLKCNPRKQFLLSDERSSNSILPYGSSGYKDQGRKAYVNQSRFNDDSRTRDRILRHLRSTS